MTNFKTRFAAAGLTIAAFVLSAAGAPHPNPIELQEWQRGCSVVSTEQPDMRMFLWFYEWTLFGAIRPGEHNSGTYDFYREVSANRRHAVIRSSIFHLSADAVPDGADLELRVTNITDFDWPELATIIPCFNPGRKEGATNDGPAAVNALFGDIDQERTFYLGAEGLTNLVTRAIHFNHTLRSAIDKLSDNGSYVFTRKWPTSPDDARAGLIIRESSDGKWVAGIAWQDYLSVQGHNPWLCMHHSVRVGPLARGESKTVRGKIYLFQGDKDDLLGRFRADFP